MADKNFLTEIIDADLAEGKIREIHTRFPPEPNGYLHIGSAKAIYINWSIANQYGGKFNLRLDDTNPAREGEEYVNSIIEDLHWLGADPNGGIFYGSDYFDKCYEYAEKLILEGKAYVDDLTRDEMREYRGSDAGKPSRPSPWRDRTPEENLDLFRRMRAGEFKEGEKTLRAKIDLAIPNTVQTDEKNVWIGSATGTPRVQNVKIYDKASGSYLPLDPGATYALAGMNYTLRNLGDGFAMFDGAELIKDYVSEDYLVMSTYAMIFDGADAAGLPHLSSANSPLAAYPGYLLDYEQPYGAGRITIL